MYVLTTTVMLNEMHVCMWVTVCLHATCITLKIKIENEVGIDCMYIQEVRKQG